MLRKTECRPRGLFEITFCTTVGRDLKEYYQAIHIGAESRQSTWMMEQIRFKKRWHDGIYIRFGCYLLSNPYLHSPRFIQLADGLQFRLIAVFIGVFDEKVHPRLGGK